MAREAMEPELVQEFDDDGDEDDEEGSDEIEEWDDWNSDEEGEDSAADLVCLFCDSRFDSAESLFARCDLDHHFDFHRIVRDLGLDFYGSIKLINYVRSRVAENKCWSCGQTFKCNDELQNHLHRANNYKIEGKVPWEADSYLKPFMEDDSLLHSLSMDDDEDDCAASMEKKEKSMSNESLAELHESNLDAIINGTSEANDENKTCQVKLCSENIADQFHKAVTIGITVEESGGSSSKECNDRQLKIARASVAARAIKNVDDDYFGSYSSFGIHREMLSDNVRTDAYRDALLSNPSLMKEATVLDVGCGTGILSLFAAQAGASRVIAVEASQKMASIATQIAKNNGRLADESGKQRNNSQVISVVQTMVEELSKNIQIPPHGFDVLVSEWMGYCLLYESMLSSVLYARDHFLKPGGAILPDTATIFGAGFGKGGTCLPFWENVYGFDMSCVGKEAMGDAARVPIVDMVDSRDIVTGAAMLHSFDLATMKQNEMDFTSTFELKLKTDDAVERGTMAPGVTWCYGIVLWFETGFTSSFCKEKPVILSTSPLSPQTHWSQTIFTFQEAIAMTKDESAVGLSASVGTQGCPAVMIRSRISIARASEHRSIDISMETTGMSCDGRKCSWPVQIFHL